MGYPRSGHSGLVTNILLVILGTIFAIFLAELVLKVMHIQPLYSFEKGLFMNSKDYYYCFTPFVEKIHSQPEYSYKIKANSYGFRGREPNFNAKYRILILGDSVGMGLGVEENETSSTLSQNYFNEKGMDVYIFNTSIPSYSGINELAVLKKFIKDYKPSLVILLFCWNDFDVDHSLYVQDGYLVLRAENNLVMFFGEWLNSNSHLFCLIKRFFYSIKDKLYYERKVFFKKNDTIEIFTREHAKVIVSYISKMKQICDTNNATFITILPLDSYRLNSLSPLIKKYFTNELESHSILFRDATAILSSQDATDLFFKLDGHLNQKGNLYFSKFLNKVILEAMNAGNSKNNR
jgi:hypothetical protein